MEGHKSKIGKDQMRQYMGGLYENSMVVYREYLQNACDAVEQALEAGLIPNRKHANIAVIIDQFNKCITIKDVGIGIERENIGPYLVDVASSQKFNKQLVGRHGIGRLNGANYCDKIIYETSAEGEPVKSTLVWDVKLAKELCADDSVDMDTTEIIDRVTYLEPEQEEELEKHYCNVTLVNVNDPHLMDEQAVKEYIAGIVSVAYSLEFRENMLMPALVLSENKNYAEKFNSLWTYEVTVNGSPIEKTYQSEYDGKQLGIMQCFTLIDDKTQEELAWGWYALNKTAEQLNDLPFSFLRARHHNFQIGADELLNGYHYGVGAKYVIGELHVTHQDINPTATRDGFEGGPSKRKLETALRRFLKDVVYTQYNRASKFRSDVVAKVAASDIEIARLKLQSKDADAEEKTRIKDKIKKQNEERKTALSLLPKYQDYFENNGSWHVADDIVEAVNESIIHPFNQKPLIQKTDSQVSELKIKDFKPKQATTLPIPPTHPANPDGVNTPIGNTDNPGSSIITLPHVPSSTPATPTEFDHYKELSRVERDLIKKFLSVISAADIPDKAKERIYTRLRKKIIKK